MINRINEIFNKIIEFRRTIHSNPELSFKEYQTTNYIESILDEYKISHKRITDTGVVALIGNGDNCVALRADIDALPIEEENSIEFKSCNTGVMHACGHDMHTAMLLGATIILKEMENELNGQVKIIFQPGEEKIPGGGKLMIDAGVLENPKPSAIFGQHIFPDGESGKIYIKDGYVMASADELYWTLKGKGAHAAQPHQGNDSILAAANLINYLQSIVSRTINPLSSGVLSVTSIHGGSATNIIPEEVKLMGTFRSYDNEWRMKSMELINEASVSICKNFGVECSFDPLLGYPPLFNNKETTEFAKKTAEEILGSDNVMEFEPKMWAEDFAFYSQLIPATFWFIGSKQNSEDTIYGLHNPKLNPDENLMKNGTALLVNTAINYLEYINKI